ncbi:porin family protein [Ferruginibacter sp. SUN106]|uniref:porin family protein n=1 Tax=Ferruginibacter sp. SUN106 TaxID=2978348 RepID=UPI003D36D822
MKNLLAALLVFSTLSATAQRNKLSDDHENFFRFGVKGGVNVNKITGQSYKSGFNYNYQLGAFMQFNFASRIGIQPEVNFVQTSTEFTNDPNDIYNDIFRDGSQKKSKLNYLEVPVLLNVSIGPSKRVKLQFGPAYGGLLSQTVDSLKTNGNIYKNADWSAIGGLWIQLPFINMGARYKLGLSDINNIDNQQTWKNQAIQVFVGVTF